MNRCVFKYLKRHATVLHVSGPWVVLAEYKQTKVDCTGAWLCTVVRLDNIFPTTYVTTVHCSKTR